MFRVRVFACTAFAAASFVLGSSPIRAQIDNSALAVLAQHLNAVGAVKWTALTGTGTITLPGSAATGASLTINASSESKLSIQNGQTLQSITTDGQVMRTAYADGTTSTMVGVAGLSGLMQFQFLRASDFSTRLLSLTDAGPATVDGASVREITASFREVDLPTSPSAPKIQVEFDFDPVTMYLSRSVTWVTIPGLANNFLPLATSYSDYRTVGKTLVPFRITQTLDGQPQWDLKLSNVTLPSSVDHSLLTF